VTPPSSTPVARSGYRLHWVTWLVTAAFAGILTFHQIIGFQALKQKSSSRAVHFVGWPQVHTMWVRDALGDFDKWSGPEIWTVGLDVVCSVAVVVSVAFIIQRTMSSRMQFGARTLLALVLTQAMLKGLGRQEI